MPYRQVKSNPNYEVSTDGQVRSVQREIKHPNGNTRRIGGNLIKPKVGSKGRLYVRLLTGDVGKVAYIDIMVADAFLNLSLNVWSPIVEHIDGDMANNSVDNLRVVSRKERVKVKSGDYPGVYWHDQACKWRVRANIDGKQAYLGLFDDEQEAYTEFLRVMHRYNG